MKFLAAGLMIFLLAACDALYRSSGDETASRNPAGLFSASTEYGKDSTRDYFDNPEVRALHSRSELMGRDVWMKATGGNERFHAYAIGQRISDRGINFWRILKSAERGSRFNNWGLMNDPDCCTPGDSGCPAKSLRETFGMDFCPGDDELIRAVGKAPGTYRDPACELDKNISSRPTTWQSSCDLKFGTSAGAVGFRKFPNPRFNREKWLRISGNSDESWDGFSAQIADASIEPPYRIGIACASCHVSFDPIRPPADVNHPRWSNLNATIGNQYLYIAQIFASGFRPNEIEYQTFANSRPGTVDTSAFPNDQVHNPGAMNAIFNLSERPKFSETVETWRRAAKCSNADSEDLCTCNQAGSRCYQKSRQRQSVFHELKGGEDSSGVENSILRVYINIGTCAESCWLNHLTDLRVLGKSERNYGETPFDSGQCRRDCPQFRALEDRVELERDFLIAAAPADLLKAKGFKTQTQLNQFIEQERGFGGGSVSRGRDVFAQICARCHSSQTDDLATRDFLKINEQGRRVDWLGSDQRVEESEVGTFACRARHTNHQTGNIWSAYSSEEQKAGGLGYYRAISLLGLWATAPFMHNNAVGPEICAAGSLQPGLNIKGASPCLAFDPSVDGRLRIFEMSMESLLNPTARQRKTTLTTSEIRIPIGPQAAGRGMTLVIPKGVSVARVGSFRHKDFLNDLIDGHGSSERLVQFLKDLRAAKNGEVILNEALLKKLGKTYSNCTDEIEDRGHVFGADLSPTAKRDLTAFMETL